MLAKKLFLFVALMAGLGCAQSLMAQGTFTLFNGTPNTYNFLLLAAEDDCSNANASGTLSAAPFSGTSFTAPTSWTGAFKALIAFDCNIGAVESPAGCFGGNPLVTTFVDCNGNTVGVQWISENVGVLF